MVHFTDVLYVQYVHPLYVQLNGTENAFTFNSFLIFLTFLK